MKILLYSQAIKATDEIHIKHLIDAGRAAGFELFANETLSEFSPKFDVLPFRQGEDFSTKAFDLVITLGGDGTILGAINLVRASQVPILGINLGRMGFLSSVEKTRISDAIQAAKAQAIASEARTLLEVDCNLPIFPNHNFALNDFTISKRDTSSMVTIHTYIDGAFLNSYWADGIIVCTPTGSTGYSLSCGGPIVFPSCNNFVITPIAPHNLNVRPLIISDDSTIRFEIEGRAENYLCTLDSRYESITQDYQITVKKCHFKINLARLEDITFMKTIRNKLMWGLDKRN